MGRENVPDFLGGSVARSELVFPQGMDDIESVGVSRGIRRGSIAKFRQVIREASNLE